MRDDQPIVAYQFNPLNDSGVFSNDASLLLPASAIGSEYYVMSWPGGVSIPGMGPQTGWFTIVASAAGVTNVEITFSSDVVAGTSSPLQGITAGTTRSFPLTQWSCSGGSKNHAKIASALCGIVKGGARRKR